MKESAARVRFSAADVLALLNLATAQKLDELWFIRNTECSIQTPDAQVRVDPVAIEGDSKLTKDFKLNPRVEVLELHNHVLRILKDSNMEIDNNTFVDVCFTDDEEFCLVLAHECPCEITEEFCLVLAHECPCETTEATFEVGFWMPGMCERLF